ncbi:MAG: flagellar basal body P-ring protein FlgI [Planctomycetaceae bacterium]|jgi:flagellar basal body P-ring protein FlgI|nr:flagellar basal body P-ring protein FlgI [Planctomycetaceae bacterium]
MSLYFKIIWICFLFFCCGVWGCAPWQKAGKVDVPDPTRLPESVQRSIEQGQVSRLSDYVLVSGLNEIEVRGVGLVQNLVGTGFDDVNSIERAMMYEEMKKMGISNINELLAEKSTAVVNIKGRMRAGIRENELFDIQVSAPVESGVRSLRNGYLVAATLQDMRAIEGSVVKGEVLAVAEGSIMVSDPLATESNNPSGLKQGVILSGARSRKTRYLFVSMKSEYESAAMTKRIADVINNRFYISSGQKKGMATAKNNVIITLDVPPVYRNDVHRYVRVVESLAYHETPSQQQRRIERLKSDLLVPSKSQNAAFQLEAIGGKVAIEALRTAMSAKDEEVLFHVGTSLAYLGDGSASKVLARIVRDNPAFRIYALNALSLLRNDIDAELALHDLLQLPSAETRYGAFRALCQRNPSDRAIRGESLGRQFSYHGIAVPVVQSQQNRNISMANWNNNTNTEPEPVSPPMVHLTRAKKPEIVLFGNDIKLIHPFVLDAGPTIFVNGNNTTGEITIKKFATKADQLDESRMVNSNNLDDVIRAVVDIGGTYPDVVQMLCQADQKKCLSCPVKIDSLPEANRFYQRKSEQLPETEQTEKPKTTFWSRFNIKNWFAPNPGQKSSDYEGYINESDRK